MRNVFDQYQAPENRLTHALGCALSLDRRLRRAFVTWITRRRDLDWRRIQVVEQQVPGTLSAATDDEGSGLPDLWLYGDGTWSLVVESKVMAGVKADQLARHRRTALRAGFTEIDLLVISPQTPAHPLDGVVHRTWPEVYSWLRRQARHSEWAARVADYMEVAEQRMMADGYLGDVPLTKFDGIPFGPEHPYTWREAKRVLKLATGELRRRPDLRRLGVASEIAGRSAITGRDGIAVWDFLTLKTAPKDANFTAYPHLTLSIQSTRTLVIVTLPNATPGYMRANIKALGRDGFGALLREVERGVSRSLRHIRGASPHLEVVQRHYRTQRSNAVVDARLEFDLRTAVGASRGGVKLQPQWMEATFDALAAKRSNLQVGLGAILQYGDSHVSSKAVLDVIAGVWVACRPWINVLIEQDQ